MEIFGISFQNHIGKYDRYHFDYENAFQNFNQLCQCLMPGEKIVLLQINLSNKKVVMKLEEIHG